MKHVSIESFIKKTLNFEIRTSDRSKKIIGSLFLFIFLTSISGIAVTSAQAPSEEETSSIDAENGFVSEEDRKAALEKLAAEVRRITHDKEEILWLARVIYSETKRFDEMYLVAEVIDNRVKNGHRAFDYERGINSFKGAALAKSQFSGMHPHLDRNAHYNLSKSYDSVGAPAWDQALKVATEVYYSDDYVRKLPTDTIYFYSPTVISAPSWALASREVYRLPSNRFAFYAPKYN